MIDILRIMLETNAVATLITIVILILIIISFAWMIISKLTGHVSSIKINYNDGIEISTSKKNNDLNGGDNIISDLLYIIEDTVPIVLGRMIRVIVNKESERFNMDTMRQEKIERICKASIYDFKRLMISYMIDIIKERTNEKSVTKIIKSKDYIAVETICESSCDKLKHFSKIIVERNHLEEMVNDDLKISSLINEMRTYIYTEIGLYEFGDDLNINKIDLENALMVLSDSGKEILKKSLKDTIETNKEFRIRDFSIDEEIQKILEEITGEIINHVSIKLTVMDKNK